VRTIYLFDVDGTLTGPRQEIDENFASVFLDWMEKENAEVYLVSGSDIKKIQQQIFNEFLNQCTGIFCCTANQLYKKEKLIYENIFTLPPFLIEDLEIYLEEAQYSFKTGNHIEQRPGMLNFSVLGRNANLLQRETYAKWDRGAREREDIVEYITSNYPELDASIGGVTSVDIYPKGKDKSQVVKYLRGQHQENISMIFVGDKTMVGGNDHPLAVVLEQDPNSFWFQVESYEETRALIEHSKLFIAEGGI
jgi:phosphomannomutase